MNVILPFSCIAIASRVWGNSFAIFVSNYVSFGKLYKMAMPRYSYNIYSGIVAYANIQNLEII